MFAAGAWKAKFGSTAPSEEPNIAVEISEGLVSKMKVKSSREIYPVFFSVLHKCMHKMTYSYLHDHIHMHSKIYKEKERMFPYLSHMLTLGTLNGAHGCVLTSTSDDQGAICLLPTTRNAATATI